MIALHDIVPTAVHIEIANASSESNHPIQIEALHIPEPHTAPTPTTLGSASTSELHSHPQSQHRPLTLSIASSSPLVVPHKLRVGATLVATCNQLQSVGREATRCPPTTSTSIPLPRGQSTGRGEVGVEVLSRRTSVRGTGTRGLGLEVEAGQGMPLPSMMLVQVKTKVNLFLVEMHQMNQLQIKCVQIVEA